MAISRRQSHSKYSILFQIKVRYRLKKTPSDWKKYLLSFTSMLSIVVGVLIWKLFITWQTAYVAWGLIGLLLIVGLLSNKVSGNVYRVGMAIGFQIGRVFGAVLLFLMFCVVITPLGLFLRLIGKDLLNFQAFKNLKIKSYWVTSKTPGSIDHMH